LDIGWGGPVGGLGGFSHERRESVGEVILAARARILDDLVDEVDKVESFWRRGVTQAREPEACYTVCMSSRDKLVPNRTQLLHAAFA
jgi:hypothetical protein